MRRNSAPLVGKKIWVVGGGILGATSASVLAGNGAEVTLIAQDYDRTLSAHVNGGLLEPYLSLDYRLPEWFATTLTLIRWLAQGELGPWVETHDALMYSHVPERILPDWREIVPNFTAPVKTPHPKFPYAARYQTLTVRPDRLMEVILQICQAQGVTLLKQRVRSLRGLIRAVQPDAVVVAAGKGMRRLWPDPLLELGRGLLAVVEVPPLGAMKWLDRLVESVGVNFRDTILMCDPFPSYSIPRRSNIPGWKQIGIGGTNEPVSFADRTVITQELVDLHRLHVAEGLPSGMTALLDRLGWQWRIGDRPLRPLVLTELKSIQDVPVVGLGGVAGSGISVFGGVVAVGVRHLMDALGNPWEGTDEELLIRSLTMATTDEGEPIPF